MKRKNPAKGCWEVGAAPVSIYKVDSIISVDGRGQTVLPKELRKRAGIKAGDKLAVTVLERDGKVCCINLIKIDELTELLKDRLEPVMRKMV